MHEAEQEGQIAGNMTDDAGPGAARPQGDERQRATRDRHPQSVPCSRLKEKVEERPAHPVTSHVRGRAFALAVAVASAGVIGIGGFFISRRAKDALAEVGAAYTPSPVVAEVA